MQLQGEEKGFDFLEAPAQEHERVHQVRAAPAKAAASGETLIGITFLHDLVMMAVQGGPLKTVAPCEGTGYEVGSMTIIKGGRTEGGEGVGNDWRSRRRAQSIGAEAKAFQMPSNKSAKIPPQVRASSRSR